MRSKKLVIAANLAVAAALIVGCSPGSYLSYQPATREASTLRPSAAATATTVPAPNLPSGPSGAGKDCAPATPIPGKINTTAISPYIEPGKMTVIFDLSYAVRLGADKRSVTALDCALQSAINNILEKYRLENASDFTSSGEFPTAQNKSTFSFQFPRAANTLAISNEIFALPGVTAAYPSVLSTP